MHAKQTRAHLFQLTLEYFANTWCQVNITRCGQLADNR